MSSVESLKWAVGHDPCRLGDRTPVGAVTAGTPVRLVLRVDAAARGNVVSGSVLVGECSTSDMSVAWRQVALHGCMEGFEATLDLASAPHVAFYAFSLELDDGQHAYYVPRADGRSTAGELVAPQVDGAWTEFGWIYSGERLAVRPMGDFGLEPLQPGFQVTVYDAGFSTPDWMSGAVMYQIFPDRFFRGEGGVREAGLAYHERMGRTVRLHAKWNEPVEWLGDVESPEGESRCAGEAGGNAGVDEGAGSSVGEAPNAPDDGEAARERELAARMSAYDPVDFHGGTLEGIRQKLPYLASLGVEALYLNPVFEARSNHRYDTADYGHIDPLLGSDEDFERLAAQAREQGIALVLDAVLSHTGNDSRYFNALGNYDEAGAAQGSESPFYSWYTFTPDDGGVGYKSWWGFPTLPEVNERDPYWQACLLGAGASDAPDEKPAILPKWLKAGAGGYRLDVADEIPDDVLALLRACVKAEDPDAAIIGEVWEDATTKASYGARRDYALGASLDSVMNYPLRAALVGFALGRLDAYQLAAFLKSQQSNYPAAMHRCLMNLLSTHDVERIRSVLALGGPLKQHPRNEQLELVAAITPEQDARAARLQRMIVGLLYALPGMPCVYYGDEKGLQGASDPFCRASFPWEAEGREDCGEDLTAFYGNLGSMRKESGALKRGLFGCAAVSDDVLCAVRVLPEKGDVVVAVTNRSMRGQALVLDLLSPDLAFPPAVQGSLHRYKGPSPFLSYEDGLAAFVVAPCATRYFQFSVS